MSEAHPRLKPCGHAVYSYCGCSTDEPAEGVASPRQGESYCDDPAFPCPKCNPEAAAKLRGATPTEERRVLGRGWRVVRGDGSVAEGWFSKRYCEEVADAWNRQGSAGAPYTVEYVELVVAVPPGEE